LFCLGALAGGGGQALAASHQQCTAGLTIFSTSTGTVTQAGPITFYRHSGVGGSYTSGFLQGYAINGAQDIVMNTTTNRSFVAGSFTASGPGGSLVISYTGSVDPTGKASGHFEAQSGTGQFDHFHWSGSISGQAVGPATFQATDSGTCSGRA
jgi:hypothetical protein